MFSSKIKRLISEGLLDEALAFYAQHVHPHQLTMDTAFIVPSVIKACVHSRAHQSLGQQVQCNLLKNGLDSEFTVSNSLLTMYAKCMDTLNAQKLFDNMRDRDTVSWNSMINCYTQNGFLVKALKMLEEMYFHGFAPKAELVASCISSCVETENWRFGRAMHALLFLDERIEHSSFVATSLVNFYWKAGDPDMAFHVFDRMVEKNEVSWTTMISGCIEHQDYLRALSCLRDMQVENIKPNRVTLISILPVCAKSHSTVHGREIHGYGIRQNYDSDVRFNSSLLHMYCECSGSLHTAKLIFDRSVKRGIVMWSSMILGFSKSKDCPREAIRLFNQMQMQGILPNSVTLLALISVCTSLLSPIDGHAVHGYSKKSGLGGDVFVQNAFIDMYSKCGCLDDSVRVFHEMAIRDRVSWGSLVSAYGLYGRAKEALHVFYEMQMGGIRADGILYLSLLSACNHAGLVDEGRMLFLQASRDVNVILNMEHYACFVDLLGKAGKLQDACDVVCGMPMRPSPRILSSFVSACKIHGRLDIMGCLALELVRMEPENAGNYTLLSMVFAESGNWAGVEEVRRYMRERKLRKNKALAKI